MKIQRRIYRYLFRHFPDVFEQFLQFLILVNNKLFYLRTFSLVTYEKECNLYYLNNFSFAIFSA